MGPAIIGAVLLGACIVQAYWPQLGDLIERWREWRGEREWSRRHTQAGRNK